MSKVQSLKPLDYAPPPSRRSKIRRRVIAAMTAFFTLVLLWRIVPIAWQRGQLLYWQSRCMNYTAPPDRKVVSVAGGISLVPQEWSKFYSLLSPPGFISAGTVFLHERTTPKGEHRLVAVDFSINPAISGETVALARVIEPESPVYNPNHYTLYEGGLRLDPKAVFYAGQPDPKDASHFTIRTSTKDREGIIDGWLIDGDSVLLEPRTATSIPSIPNE